MRTVAPHGAKFCLLSAGQRDRSVLHGNERPRLGKLRCLISTELLDKDPYLVKQWKELQDGSSIKDAAQLQATRKSGLMGLTAAYIA